MQFDRKLFAKNSSFFEFIIFFPFISSFFSSPFSQPRNLFYLILVRLQQLRLSFKVVQMLAEYQRIVEEKTFNYEKVLERLGIRQESVDLLRQKTRNSRFVPKVIDDRNVMRAIKSF
jgi:hypothetical protein